LKKELLFAGALTLTAGCTSAVEGGGTYTRECIDHVTAFQMQDQQTFYAGIGDMSFTQTVLEHERDYLEFKRVGDTLVLDGNSGDDSSIDVSGIKTELGSPFTIQLTNETQEAVLIEDDSQVAMTMTLDEKNVAIVSLAWACDQ
jgi:hypothetical protein